MTKTWLKSRLCFNKAKSKPKQEITSVPAPPNSQTFKQRMISGSGFRVFDDSLKS